MDENLNKELRKKLAKIEFLTKLKLDLLNEQMKAISKTKDKR